MTAGPGERREPPWWGAGAGLAALEESWPPAERRAAAGLALRSDAAAAGSRVNAARRLSVAEQAQGAGGSNGGSKSADPERAADAILAFYAERGRTPLYQAAYPLAVAQRAAAPDADLAAAFTPQDALERRLAAQGFALFDPCLLFVASADAAAEAAETRRPDDPRLRGLTVAAPLAALRALWEAGDVGPERRAVMARARAGQVVAFRQAQGLGGALFLGLGGGVGFLHALHATPEARRQGGARQAVGLAAQLARDAGVRELAALVRLGNHGARGFFTALGFNLAGAYAYWRRDKRA